MGTAIGGTAGTGCAATNRVKLGLCFFAISFIKQSRHSVQRSPRAVSVCHSAALTVTGGVARTYA